MVNNIEPDSEDVFKEKKEAIGKILPGVIVEGKLDVKKLKRMLGEDNLHLGEDKYDFTWAGQSKAYELIKETTSKSFEPQRDKSVNFDQSENIFIEGNNLDALKILQKAYSNSVKMIYIDPPYNTGSDFVYKDDFRQSKREYEEATGQRDDKGNKLVANPKTNGRFHSDWLTMLYPRLFLSRNLLKEDGVIFVSIDDNEIHNLRMIMNDIFGEENFISCLVWTNKEGGGGSDSKYFREKHEYILCYAKNKSKVNIKGTEITNRERYRKKDEHVDERGPYYLQQLNQSSIQYSEGLDYEIEAPDGTKIDPHKGDERACWRWSKEKVQWGIKNDFIEFKKRDEGWKVYTKQYLKVDNEGNKINRTMAPMALIDEFSSTQATKELKELFNGKEVFSYPKPYPLINWLAERVTEKNDVVLDFFAGSGTTAQSVIDLNKKQDTNRKFILIQIPEEVNEDSRAKEEGYDTITQIAEERIKRVIEQEKTEGDSSNSRDNKLGFKYFSLIDSNFRDWEPPENVEELKEQMVLQENPWKPDSEKESVLYELLLKEGFTVNANIIQIEDLKQAYKIKEDGRILYIDLSEDVKVSLVEDLEITQETTYICKDSALTDTKKHNLSELVNLKAI